MSGFGASLSGLFLLQEIIVNERLDTGALGQWQ